ncbi:amidase [Aeromicrobium ponti]|uniref:Aspartyl-tRNA(Asn)/glutamyl-tRNA(Gln) amidotransferase subunit A n=1 Tax=Cytobacillus oceanisediminis TaxID=665099 RepID=A0A562JRK7_9BACI|nr:amidase [Cytobacillus oceanisediminis]TWH85781.1 aspartyl-tRNA(Asn)/glutamyl-tRNA(Gln) amidotransferase subunit A [Cytobacillus oceanisediminis]
MAGNKVEFLEWSFTKLSESIRTKEISPVEVVEESIKYIEQTNTKINAFITVMYDEAAEKAKKAESEILRGEYKGTLHGVPIGLKDIIYTKGTRTTFGAERYKDFIPNMNAEIVNKLDVSGAIIIGKQNLHQFAYGTTGDRSFFGPTLNPKNTEKVTGGSSAGGAAAVAADMCYASIGSDTGGSIRIPASFCGIVGMKPTYGLVSKHGSMALSWSLDHLGPMTKTVKDNALLLNAIAGYDSKDPQSDKSQPTIDFSSLLGKSIKNLRIGVPSSFYFDIIQEEVLEKFEKVIDLLKSQGVEIVPVKLEHMDELLISQQVVISTESFTSLENEVSEAPEMIDDEVRSRILGGMLTQASDYIRMLRMKNFGIEMFKNAMRDIDLMVTPTICALPSDIEQRVVYFDEKKEHPRIFARLTGPTNTVGFPSLSVPGGKSSNGLPIGIQFIGRPYEETTLYQVGYALEQLIN